MKNLSTNAFRLPAFFVLSAGFLCLAGCCTCCVDGMRNAGGGTFTPTPSPYIVTVSDADFDSAVVRGDKPTLVDFWAPWCGPCQMVDPAMVAVADEFHEQINIARINIDENQGTAQRYQVWGIPLLAIFHNGEIVAKHEGVPMDGSGDIEQATRDWVAREIAKIETVGPD